MANQNPMKTTQVVTTEPPAFVATPLNEILAQARGIYANRNTGAGQADIRTATDQMRNMAKDAWRLYNPAFTTVGQVTSGQSQIGTGQAFDAMARNGVPLRNGVAQDVRRGDLGVATEADYRGLLDEAAAPGAAESYLTATARGDHLANGDPYLDDVIADSSASIANQLKDMYSGAGRYGGATMNVDLINRLYANEAGTRSAAYQQERDRQVQAASLIEDAQQGRLGYRRGVTGDITGVQQGNIDNRLGAENLLNQNALANAGFQLDALSGLTDVQAQNIQNRMAAAELLPTLDAARYQGPDRLMALGELANNRPWDDLGKFADIVYPMAGFGGTQTMQEPSTPWLDAIGAIGDVVGWFR